VETDYLGIGVEEGTKVIIFHLADEVYGIEALYVQEISRVSEITRVPRAPTLIEGVINLRGSIIPVLDLRRRFDLPRSGYTRDTRMIIVEGLGEVVGLIVDRVAEVLSISPDLIDRSPTFLTGPVDSESLIGVAKLKGKLVVLLNIDKVLEIPR